MNKKTPACKQQLNDTQAKKKTDKEIEKIHKKVDEALNSKSCERCKQLDCNRCVKYSRYEHDGMTNEEHWNKIKLELSLKAQLKDVSPPTCKICGKQNGKEYVGHGFFFENNYVRCRQCDTSVSPTEVELRYETTDVKTVGFICPMCNLTTESKVFTQEEN